VLIIRAFNAPYKPSPRQTERQPLPARVKAWQRTIYAPHLGYSGRIKKMCIILLIHTFLKFAVLQTEHLDPPALLAPGARLAFWDDDHHIPQPPTHGEISDRPPWGLSTQEKVARAEYGIHRLFEAGNPLTIAYSAGKDSSVLLAIVLDAARSFKESGGTLPLILVTHANTGIENPAFQVVAIAEIARIRAFAATHGLPVRVDVVQPALNDTWAVRIISGSALPTFANSS
jgi:hypothetical protein